MVDKALLLCGHMVLDCRGVRRSAMFRWNRKFSHNLKWPDQLSCYFVFMVNFRMMLLCYSLYMALFHCPCKTKFSTQGSCGLLWRFKWPLHTVWCGRNICNILSLNKLMSAVEHKPSVAFWLILGKSGYCPTTDCSLAGHRGIPCNYSYVRKTPLGNNYKLTC